MTTALLVMAVGGGLIAYALHERALERRRRVRRALQKSIRMGTEMMKGLTNTFNAFSALRLVTLSAHEAALKFEQTLRRVNELVEWNYLTKERGIELEIIAERLGRTSPFSHEHWLNILTDGARRSLWQDLMRSVQVYDKSGGWVDPAAWAALGIGKEGENGPKTENV